MKILPIGDKYIRNNNYTNYTKIKRNNIDYDKNITDISGLNKNYNQITFQSISREETLKWVQKIPLEERIATIYERCMEGDLIITGKKINNAKLGMLQAIGQIDRAIKRIFFVPDEKLNGYLGFMKDEDSHQILNLNEFPIKIVNEDVYETGKTSTIKSVAGYDSYYVADGSEIWLQNQKKMKFRTEPQGDVTEWMKNYTSVKNFTNAVNAQIEKINRKTVAQLSKEAKEDKSKVMFKDVGGQDELISELKKSVIYPLRYPEVYKNFELNKGFVLYGPPGTGKTHIAKALANEAEVNFVSLNGKEMESKWVGESEENWRNLFEEAKQKQPTILFIDEIDSIGRKRGGQDVYGDDVVSQILTLMTDIYDNGENVFVIGATNNFKALDEALIRPGRLSKHLEVKLPDLDGVKKIFDIHSDKKPLDKRIDKDALILRLHDLKTSGADIKYIINEAYTNGYERAGIFEKMEKGTLIGQDMRNFRIIQEDFDKAIKKFVETRHGTERQTIGFKK